MTNHTRIAGLVLAAVALTTTPAFAQRNHGDGSGDRRNGGDRQRAERAAPRSRESQQPNVVVVPRGSQPAHVVPRGSQPTYVVPRSSQPTYVVPRSSRPTYVVPRYNYAPYVYRAPYGYRPYGYRPGWNLNLYFGAPYYAYGYPGYGYAPSAGYGYYSLVPGRAYGAVRIVDAPRNAQVFVDGNYAGVVDDYDGVFQHLNLEAGAHRIEIQLPGAPPIEFDVLVRPGETVTYHAFGRN